jgi:hypothetical protein
MFKMYYYSIETHYENIFTFGFHNKTTCDPCDGWDGNTRSHCRHIWGGTELMHCIAWEFYSTVL